MFATTQTHTSGSPRHRQSTHLPVGSKRTALSSPVARGGCVTSHAAASSPGAAPTVSTPVHFTKVFKMGGDGTSTGAKAGHARSKSFDGMTCGVMYNTSSDTIGVKKRDGDVEKNTTQNTATHLDSPLRSRRALPSLSVGAANDNTLKGRPGIVYIDGTKMPQDGWYQRCFGCGMWTAQSVVLGQFEVYRCRCCAREFRSRAKSLSNLSSDVRPPRGKSRSSHRESSAATCSSDEVSQSSLLTSDTATTVVSTRSRSRRSPRGVTSGGGGAEGGREARGNVVAAARRAVRRSSRASVQRQRNGESAMSAELPPLHPSSSAAAAASARRNQTGALTAAGTDTEMFDASEVADSENAQQHHSCAAADAVRPDAEVLTSLVSKLRDFLVVNLPHNSVENSLRRCDSSPHPPPTLQYT